ncbi:MAG TPA: FliG C-terminal domain-containing protein [Candidatus Cloacimonadota bacterium]|mgnify:CR=1 FL=1|jgi:flagellar motor switch protein FliG|nr:FliG C-terminal domain-containing protein [Candidatus Cloacimonadota bacterium]HPM01528.1 FliG C-terminal domain-containing protein [Candidatus Cloacimonadota bacterium]
MKAFSVVLLEDNETIMKLIDCLPVMDLAIALKHAEEDLQNFFFDNMPIHKKQTILELMNELEDISIEDSIKVQHEIVNILNNIKKEGCCC